MATLPPPGALGFKPKVSLTGHKIPTPVSSARGWKIGLPINNLTRAGNTPKWNTIKSRYWKNQAYYDRELYTIRNLDRMKKGMARQQINQKTGKLESIELHHNPPQRDGGLFDFIEVTPYEHAFIDPFRNL